MRLVASCVVFMAFKKMHLPLTGRERGDFDGGGLSLVAILALCPMTCGVVKGVGNA